LLNTTLVLGNASEESALPLRGKKRKLTRSDWVDYLCRERLGLLPAILDPILHSLDAVRDEWVRKIENSYLSASAQTGYVEILSERRSRLFG
jgi:serine/threonine-protein kinase HipA